MPRNENINNADHSCSYLTKGIYFLVAFGGGCVFISFYYI